MHARLTWFTGIGPDRLDATIERVGREIPTLEEQDGFEGVLILVDREGGSIGGISLWDDPEHLRASEGASTRARVNVESGIGEIPTIQRYEVVFSEARTPGA